VLDDLIKRGLRKPEFLIASFASALLVNYSHEIHKRETREGKGREGPKLPPCHRASPDTLPIG
jgi:hypothetical protein